MTRQRSTSASATLAQQGRDFTAEGAPAPAAREPAPPAARMSTDDWHTLLDAIKSRLRTATDDAPTGQGGGVAVPLRVTVLECIDALEDLQAAMLGGGRAGRNSGDSKSPVHDPSVSSCASSGRTGR